jgi:hypothetical protein
VASRAIVCGIRINPDFADHLQILDAIPEVGDKELRGDLLGM